MTEKLMSENDTEFCRNLRDLIEVYYPHLDVVEIIQNENAYDSDRYNASLFVLLKDNVGRFRATEPQIRKTVRPTPEPPPMQDGCHVKAHKPDWLDRLAVWVIPIVGTIAIMWAILKSSP